MSQTASHLVETFAVGALLPGEGALNVGAEIVAPAPDRLQKNPLVFFCVPGAGFSKGYYSVRVENDLSYSFSDTMAASGHIVAALDPLGVGDSTRPEDGFALTPHIISKANRAAITQIKDRLAKGGLAGLPPLPHVTSIGVGHSMGGMIVSIDQAEGRPYDALVLLGSGPFGLDWALNDAERAYAGNPEGARANIIRLSRARHEEAYYRIQPNGRAGEIYGGTAEKPVLQAVKQHGAVMLATPGLFSMIPGAFGPEAAAIDVPLFLAIGDQDIAGVPHQAPASFPGARDITLLILPNTGHTHFAFATAPRLFRRLLDWAVSLPGAFDRVAPPLLKQEIET